LLAAISGRDGDAFAAFYRRHLPAVLAYLARETRDPEVAADLAAEVFAAVLLAARRYRPVTESAVPWVIGIARNTLGASRRRGRVEARARQRLGFRAIDLDESDLERTHALAADGEGALTELLGSLPDEERRAVEARIVRERSYAEIAAELECSQLVVRKRVSRGLARMRRRLKKT
jgi:RNA polymerase sigma factor (sigma-70 family)